MYRRTRVGREGGVSVRAYIQRTAYMRTLSGAGGTERAGMAPSNGGRLPFPEGGARHAGTKKPPPTEVRGGPFRLSIFPAFRLTLQEGAEFRLLLIRHLGKGRLRPGHRVGGLPLRGPGRVPGLLREDLVRGI